MEDNSARQQCRWTQVEAGLMRRECQGMTMAELARRLPGLGPGGIDRPVVDETGLKGAYDFHFDVGAPTSGKGDGERAGEASAAAPPPPDSAPAIFKAFEEIGLKLVGRKMPLPTIVVDRVEKPEVN